MKTVLAQTKFAASWSMFFRLLSRARAARRRFAARRPPGRPRIAGGTPTLLRRLRRFAGGTPTPRRYGDSQAGRLRYGDYGDSQAGRLRYEAWSGGRCDEGRVAGKFPRMYEPRHAAAVEAEDIDPALAEIDESILIDEGRCMARSYRTPGYMAMWLVAAGILQFYDEEGRMLATIDLFASLRPQRMAASLSGSDVG